jgi:hypothetical protein
MKLAALQVPYILNVTAFPSFLDLYATFEGPLPYGVLRTDEVQASRLIPRSLLESKKGLQALTNTQRDIAALDSGSFLVVGTALSLPRVPSAAASNSVLPAWRDAAIHQNIVAYWDWEADWATNTRKQDLLLARVLPALTRLAPRSGAYMSEGNPKQQDWKEAFYGDNYRRLSEVKEIWDPDSVFYAETGVGSDSWAVNKQGQLCKNT